MPRQRLWPKRWGGWLILYATLLHGLWGFMLLASPVGLKTTPIASVGALTGSPEFTAIIYLIVASLAVLGLCMPHYGMLLTIPQQLLLLLTAGGALSAAAMGHYPDGYQASGLFILVDQLPTILAALLHPLALLDYHGSLVPRREG